MTLGFGLRAGLLLVTWASVASAGNGNRKVDIESDPPGAVVFLDSVDKPAACAATPCTIEAPVGKSVVILRKDGYEPEFGQLSVPKKGKIKPFRFALTGGALGSLVVDNARFTGATIKVDDVDRGVAPQRIDVEAKSHRVVITLNNKELFAGDVVVETGATVTIDAAKLGASKPNAAKPDGAKSSTAKPDAAKPDATKSSAAKPDVTKPNAAKSGAAKPDAAKSGAAKPDAVKPSPETKRDREPEAPPAPAQVASPSTARSHRGSLAIGVVGDVNFRQFRYRGARTPLPTQTESGQDMLGPTLEIWPMALFGASQLRGLSLFGEFEFGVNHLNIIDDTTGKTTGTRTKWRKFELDVRHLWTVRASTITASAGFVRDQMGYQGNASSVPIGDYQAIRAGIGTGLRMAAPLEVHVAAEGRYVLDNGALGTRFGGASVFGGRLAAGTSLRLGPVFVGLEGSLLYYRWTFDSSETASGARDLVESISLHVGAQY